MSDRPIIGFVGLGLMGHSIAKNILKGGYTLWVSDLNPAPVESLVSQGAHSAANLADMAARCDVIQLCLSNSQQVEAVLRGANGIIAAARPGLIVVDSSTADPSSTAKLADELTVRGATLIDAPLGRTPKEAEEGTLDAMVGGDAASFEKLLPFIGCWAKAIKYVGPVGSGHKMKLIMNFIGMSYGALYAETVVLGAKVGLPPQVIREVIGPSRMGNGFFDTFMRYVVDRDRDAHKFTIANAAKDLRYVNNMANETNMVNAIGAAVKQYYTHVEAIGHAGDYVPMLSDHVAALSGVDMAEVVRRAAS